MKLNFKHNGSGVLNAIQRAINELAQWRGVQQDRDVDAAMGRTDQKLRGALQDIRDFQEGVLPQAPQTTVFILTCVNGDKMVVSADTFATRTKAREHMREDFDNERTDAENAGYKDFYTEAFGDDTADLAYGINAANEYHWTITESTFCA